jgi:hypothetical protein
MVVVDQSAGGDLRAAFPVLRRIPALDVSTPVNNDALGLALLLVAALRAPIRVPPHVRPTSKACSRCGRGLPLEAYAQESRARDGRRGDCRDCARNAARTRYAQRAGDAA